MQSSKTFVKTIDELKKEVLKGLAILREDMRKSHNNLGERLDKMDLNGSANHLRAFGEFLKEHPNFMGRQTAREESMEDREIAIRYIMSRLHLTNLRTKASWFAAAVAAGFLFSLGNALFGPLAGVHLHIHDIIRFLGGR